MTPQTITRTGRVQEWIDNPTSRLPVSCTVFVVDDSCDGPEGIEASWKFCSHALRLGAGVAVHLSKLRGRGIDNGKGLVSSGPVSFGKIYSVLNEVLRRGGVYRNGACVLHYDIDCPDIVEFIETPRSELPWVKRCVNLDAEKWAAFEHKDKLLAGIARGDIWLNKIKFDNNGERIFGNVCLEVYLPSRGTCLLQHVNLAACDLQTLTDTFTEAMSQLCDLHGKTGVGETGEYLSPNVDRQVGLGMLGLANLLRRYGVTYEQFGVALEQINSGRVAHTAAYAIAMELKVAIQCAAKVAYDNKMVRAFAIAPTASCSYRSQDLDGYTATPEIAPPIGRSVDRDSDTFGVQRYEYGPVEIASEVGFDNFKKVADGIMTIVNRTGLAHGYSFNSWSDCVTYDEEFIEQWLDSPQTSLYYSLQVMGDVQDKSNAYAALDDDEVSDYLSSILNTNEPQCDCAQ